MVRNGAELGYEIPDVVADGEVDPASREQMGNRRLEFLRAGTRDLPERQQTLRDTMSWSHSMLTADAQTLLARLAVFVGSASLDAIEEVANSDGRLVTLDLLASLVDTSLIRTAAEAPEPRFGMLETIREFADEQLEASGDADEYRALSAQRGSLRSPSVATARRVPVPGVPTRRFISGWQLICEQLWVTATMTSSHSLPKLTFDAAISELVTEAVGRR